MVLNWATFSSTACRRDSNLWLTLSIEETLSGMKVKNREEQTLGHISYAKAEEQINETEIISQRD